MLPTLLSIGPITISSFGFFLALGFLFATFLSWRLARAWDLNEEKILDLCLLTFFGALIGARIFFVLQHLQLFTDNFFKIALLTKYSGLSFWGGLFGGTVTLYFFTKRLRKLDFWQVADLASVGLLGGLIFGTIGCLLGGCNVGLQTSFLGVDMVGFVGKRFPVQALEALTFALALRKIWPLATHFHFPGKIACLVLMILGTLEFFLEFLRADRLGGHFFAFVVFILGLVFFYRLGKRNMAQDLHIFADILIGILTEERVRASLKKRISKSWYNQKVAFHWSLYQLKKKLRRVRVKTTTPEHI